MTDTELSPATASPEDFLDLSNLDAMSSILQVLCRTTGMRTALVARVTEDAWRASAVLDGGGFGLRPGNQLELQTTF